MKKFIGDRLAEFQFGRIIVGNLQFIVSLIIMIRVFNWPKIMYFLAVPIGFIGIWITGFICYKSGIIKHFKRKEFDGLL